MKPLSELDHYEVLEVPRDASPGQIERAYHVARTAYSDGSLATYSIFDAGETAALQQRIERAYQVLRDPSARREYDARIAEDGSGTAVGLGPPGRVSPPAQEDGPEQAPARPLAPPSPALPLGGSHMVPSGDTDVAADPLHATAFAAASEAGARDVDPGGEPEADGGMPADVDGPQLRRARERRGLGIEDVANVTKINPMYLRCLESEDVEQLPAAVYVRGFVKAYARCVGLDPAAAVTGYMARLEHPAPRRRGRLLGRS